MTVGKSRETRLAFAAIGALALGAVGCVPKYVQPTKDFAAASQATLATLAPLPSRASAQCLERARADRLNQRLISTDHRWGTRPSWSRWYSEARDPDGRTWADRCGEVSKSSQVASTALSLLSAYVSALQAVANGGGYDGTALTSVASTASELATTLKQDAVSDVAKQLGEPLTQVANVVLQQYAAYQLKELLVRGDPAVQKLIAALDRYLEAVDSQYAVVAQRQGQVLDRLEVQLSTSPDDTARILHFLEYATALEDRVADEQLAIASHRASLKGLAATHAELVKLTADDQKGAKP